MYQGTGKITSFYRGIILNKSPIQRYWRKTIKIIVISGYISLVLEAWRKDRRQNVWKMKEQVHRFGDPSNLFCSIHFTVTLAGLKNVNHYIANIILPKIVKSRFHCNAFRETHLMLIIIHWRKQASPNQTLSQSPRDTQTCIFNLL